MGIDVRYKAKDLQKAAEEQEKDFEVRPAEIGKGLSFFVDGQYMGSSWQAGSWSVIADVPCIDMELFNSLGIEHEFSY